MNIFINIIGYLCIVGLCIYIDYSFFDLLYQKSIDNIIAYRRARLLKMKAHKELRLFELQEKDTDKYSDKILKLENEIDSVIFKLNDLDKYNKKED